MGDLLLLLVLLEEVLVRPVGGAHPVVCVGPPNAPVLWWGHYYCQKAPSFKWDVKPRSWLSVVIKKSQDLLKTKQKRMGLSPPSWPICLCPSRLPNQTD